MKKEYIASLETRTGKSGNPYDVLVIKLTNGYEKLVFLDKAELELLRINSNKDEIPYLDLK